VPYALLIRWLVVIGIAVAIGTTCYIKGAASVRAEWDADTGRKATAALQLHQSQQKGMDKAQADSADRREANAKREADIRAAVRRSCGGGVLPVRPQVRAEHDGGGPPVPEVPGQGVTGAAEAKDGAGTFERDAEDDLAVTCPALYDQAKLLRDLAVSAGADKD
jgi:hypothetical protein